MPVHKLSKTGVKKIENAVEELFNRAKARLIGRTGVGQKSIGVSVIHDLTLPGLFEAAAREEGHPPNQETLETLLRISNNYLDAVKTRMQARVVNEVQAFLRDASLQGVQTDLKTVLGGKLTDIWGDIQNQLHAIADSEASQVKNVSIMEGILRVNAAEGIDDPVVYFVVVRDGDTCDECLRLHLLDNGVTPRVYKLTEVGHGYHKKGEDDPKIGGLHPHCRCTLVTLMPGYGFTKGGMVKFVSRVWNEWDFQHGNAP
jgi:hypothetical protein